MKYSHKLKEIRLLTVDENPVINTVRLLTFPKINMLQIAPTKRQSASINVKKLAELGCIVRRKIKVEKLMRIVRIDKWKEDIRVIAIKI